MTHSFPTRRSSDLQRKRENFLQAIAAIISLRATVFLDDGWRRINPVLLVVVGQQDHASTFECSHMIEYLAPYDEVAVSIVGRSLLVRLSLVKEAGRVATDRPSGEFRIQIRDAAVDVALQNRLVHDLDDPDRKSTRLNSSH